LKDDQDQSKKLGEKIVKGKMGKMGKIYLPTDEDFDEVFFLFRLANIYA
jgi:hypothetical protein